MSTTISEKPDKRLGFFNVSEILQLIEFRGIYVGLKFCFAHGMME
jgi:hypothetical protein